MAVHKKSTAKIPPGVFDLPFASDTLNEKIPKIGHLLRYTEGNAEFSVFSALEAQTMSSDCFSGTRMTSSFHLIESQQFYLGIESQTQTAEAESVEAYASAIFPFSTDNIQDFEDCLRTIFHACVFRSGSTRKTTHFTAIYEINHGASSGTSDSVCGTKCSKSCEFFHTTEFGRYILRSFSIPSQLALVRAFLDVVAATYNAELC